MSLPNPLPDNPQRWDGWRSYNSDDPYARLCLSFEANPTKDQIEENCRQLLVWWQKKLPLKNQPSNPVAQMLRAGLDEAPHLLAEARSRLLDPVQRAEIDEAARGRIVQEAILEFKKILPFAISNQGLTAEAEERLHEGGAKLGLSSEEVAKIIEAELPRLGVVRFIPAPAPEPAPPASHPAGGYVGGGDPFEEFRRMLRLSRLCLDGEEMTDDQRDALCNMGESLGLTGGQAEDLIDDYLEEAGNQPITPFQPAKGGAALAAPRPAPGMAKSSAKPIAAGRPVPAVKPPRPVEAAASKVSAAEAAAVAKINFSPMARLQEQQRYPNFTNRYGMEMMFVPSGQFSMGSESPDAAPHEQPPVVTTLRCFYIARFPVTNSVFEQFDPHHVTRRPPWADDRHPAVYVAVKETTAFCEWLSARAGHRYRLPTEAEWEYAARGTDGRNYPWGERLDAGHLANFADKRTSFPWRDANIDDGFPETAPVGSYPRGASPFGVEDLAGNVFEWCSDFFDVYRSKGRVNPRGPAGGTKRVYRGGSWKSRAQSLRASARAFNLSDYSSNDVGFRVVCECEPD